MIPNRQHAAVILIEVFGVAGVVYAMRRRRVDYPLQPADVRHELGVHEELVAQAERYHAVHPDRVISDPDDRQIEQKYAGQDRRPGEAKSGRRLHLVARVMNAVRGPEKTNAVRTAMLDIEAEVDEQEQNDQADPIVE